MNGNIFNSKNSFYLIENNFYCIQNSSFSLEKEKLNENIQSWKTAFCTLTKPNVIKTELVKVIFSRIHSTIKLFEISKSISCPILCREFIAFYLLKIIKKNINDPEWALKKMIFYHEYHMRESIIHVTNHTNKINTIVKLINLIDKVDNILARHTTLQLKKILKTKKDPEEVMSLIEKINNETFRNECLNEIYRV